MWENSAEESPVTVLDVLRVPSESLYFQGLADLGFLVRAWEKIDVTKHPLLKHPRKAILAEWKKRTELHGRHESVELLRKHQDFLQQLVSIKYSPDQQNNPHGMFALLTPGTMEVIWSTDAFSKLFAAETSQLNHMHNMRVAAGMLILIFRLYANKLDLSKLPIPRGDGFSEAMRYQPDPLGPTRYFRIRFDNEIYTSNSWCVGMECDGELPELTQKDIETILINPYSADHIRSVVDTSNFMFNGVCFIWAEEITYRHQMTSLHQRLSNRDALRRRADLLMFQEQVRQVLSIDDLEMGILWSPFDADSRRARWRPYLQSLRFSTEVDPNALAADDYYVLSQTQHQILNRLRHVNGLDVLVEKGFNSLIIAPLMCYGQCIGLFEFGSRREHAFDFYAVARLLKIGDLLGAAINHVQEGEQERIMAVIKQTCTAIHPSVEWRFQEMARGYLQQVESDQIPNIETVVFKQVVPLFGVSDIRGSSTKRNESIQADLTNQLQLAAEVIQAAGKSHPRPVFNELAFRIKRHLQAISKGLKSGDETRIFMFLRHSVEAAFDELSQLSNDIRIKVEAYRSQLDPEVGVIYQVRKNYDESVTQINDTIGAYIDTQQELAQQMIPHYFEKFKTDGVDHNIYVGDSMLESGTCSPLDLRNLYLWQLMTMCGVVWLMRDLKPKLRTPLDTAHLLLVQSTPLNITFHTEEKHFSVDGAYNARYEIVKKRIDKARIHGSSERLTQPEQIAIVYTQEREFQMYKEFISYLQDLGFIQEDYIDVLLEDLQGVHGLRALRVKVADHPPADWDPKKPHTSLAL